LLIKHLPMLVILVAVGILMFGDLVTARGLAIALTLLGSAVAGLAIPRMLGRAPPLVAQRHLDPGPMQLTFT